MSLAGGVLYFDCHAGIAGDMAVAALVDAGVPEAVIREALGKLPLDGYSIAFERVTRGVMAGLKFRVTVEEHDHDHHHHHENANNHSHSHHHEEHEHSHEHHGHHAHRHYSEIRAMIDSSSLSDGVKRRALSIFDRIAKVESKLHAVPFDEVAFHEVGAVDSIVDIVSVAAALDWLQPSRVISRVVPLGEGSVMTAHGKLPVPAPATLELLAGAKVEAGGVAFELTTPTGAAILADTVEKYGPMPEIAVAAVGWGAGDRELPDRPNLLRVVIGREEAGDAEGTRAVVLEANIDDLSPELAAPLIDQLMAAGARDAWLQPILMKKGRPGFLVGAVVDPGKRAAVEAALFRESTTIGIRAHEVSRTVLARRIVEVETPWGKVPVKVAAAPDGSDFENVAPELEACRALASAHQVPLKRVYAEALAAFFRR
jgi:uncharacterized protein (TIGR00299 family) protein